MNLIYLGMSGIRAANLSLYATGNNIANVATEGYSRRGVLLSAGALGGVDTSAMMRFNESYKTQQLWQSNGKLGQFKVAQSYLDQLEGMTGVGSRDGGAKNDLGLGAFFGALNAASTEPGSTVLRQSVLNAADSMAKQFNNMRAALNGQLRSIEQQRNTTVEQVNGLAASVADLNERIVSGQASGADVSALMDQRDVAIDKLSGLAGVKVVQQSNGAVDVSMGSGQPLVLGKHAGKMEVTRDADGRQTLSLTFGSQTMPLHASSVGGELRGLADFEGDVLRPQMESLKALAIEVSELINAQLEKGYDVNGNPGKPLMTYNASTGLLGVDPNVKPDDLAFSGDASNPGDNGNLLALIGLGSTKIDIPGLGKVSLENTFAMMMAKVGAASQQNKQSIDTAQAVRTQAENDWEALSGVDKDEEAMNVVRFKDMYNANMKVISVANELFEATLNAM
ncbi:flagellar biosynthesis protein FlgK [Burkholderia territorii]|uniref:flagellar hook-associated protein FlgK n=1 Tax=Burkholderia territorii TaxID=1503055 RepID=UPI0007587109|nr:flagellar hook-associated protein FlgK [Burkholderia territorii]KWH08469.1 flagellar biosynthesis protein FlgK [Burkholderia territorii]